MKGKNIITPTMRELRAAISEAEALTGKQSGMSKTEEARVNVLLAKIAALRQSAIAPNDFTRRWMSAFLKGLEVPGESRGNDVLAGKETITYGQGPAGGYLVPTEFNQALVLGLAQWDPLLDEDVVTLIASDDYSLRPMNVPGWDLSTYAAQRVGEATQQNPQAVPTSAQAFLNGYTYKATLDASFEFEEDNAFQPTIELMRVAFDIAMARGIGVDLVSGTGTAQPQGIVTGAHNSGVTTGALNTVTYTDVENVYFSVNRLYRNSPKCAWLVTDAVYELIRKSVDDNHRPLINIVGDRELLMGKPIYICPSLPAYNASLGAQLPGSFCVFGDLSHYIARVSAFYLTRSMQAPGYVEYGKGLYTALCRADGRVLDPTGGTTAPIVYATLHE